MEYVGYYCNYYACYDVYDHDMLYYVSCQYPWSPTLYIDHLDVFHGDGRLASSISAANHRHDVYIGPPSGGCNPTCPEP